MRILAFIILFVNNYGLTQGLIFDESSFRQRKEIAITRGDVVPSRASLKNYAPYVIEQKGATCVAVSLAVARSILYAENRGFSNRDEISYLSFSPYWIYTKNMEENDKDCELGLDIEKAVNDIILNGVLRIFELEFPEFYPFTESTLCNQEIKLKDDKIKKAKQYALANVYRIHNLDGIKVALVKGMPIIVGMVVPESLIKAYGDSVWTPIESDTCGNTFLHAMVVVGYDDSMYGGAVQIMNSWGERWGEDGFIWIKYEELLYYTLGAYALEENELFDDNFNLESDILLRKESLNEYGKSLSEFKENEYTKLVNRLFSISGNK